MGQRKAHGKDKTQQFHKPFMDRKCIVCVEVHSFIDCGTFKGSNVCVVVTLEQEKKNCQEGQRFSKKLPF